MNSQKSLKGISKICSKGHKFYKKSDCPVCPICAKQEKDKLQQDFPQIGAPALRALNTAKIKKISQLVKFSEKDLKQMHGIGPKAIEILKTELRRRKLSLKSIS